MNGAIGGIGNIGGNAGMTHAMTAIPKDPLNAEALNDINHKKHKEWEMSFEAEVMKLNKEAVVAGIQSGSTGTTGTHINKYT